MSTNRAPDSGVIPAVEAGGVSAPHRTADEAAGVTLTAAQHATLAGLPVNDRREVLAWHAALSTVRKPGVQAQLAVIARRFGVSPQTARRKHDALHHSGGDLRVLFDERRIPARERGLPWAFREEVKRRWLNNQRKFQPAFVQLCRDWRNGEVIPGYEDVSPFDRERIPWTAANLRKVCRPSKLETVARRVGMAAAKTHAPQVFTTRVGLWVGSHLMLDDVWHDNFVTFRNRPVRVLQLSVLDVFSGCLATWGTKPRFERADETMDGLKQGQMNFLLARQLFEHGWSPRGTTLLAEHGTAAVPPPLEELLARISNGAISVQRSGITGEAQALAGMMEGRGLGNFRMKSCLESLHNLIHNQLGALPGQTGMDVDHRPEPLSGARMKIRADGSVALGGLLAHVNDLAAAMAVLPPATARLLQMPLLNYEAEFPKALADVLEFINRRGEWEFFSHRLEGWAECGHVVTEFRVSTAVNAWLSGAEFLALPEPERAAIRALAQARPEAYARTRPLSPREVFEAGRAELVRPHPAVIPEILLGGRRVEEGDVAVMRRCEDGYFEFQDQEISPATLRYAGVCQPPEGRARELPDGEYLTFVNPYSPEFLFVHTHRGEFLGLCRRDTLPGRADVEAIRRKQGEVAHRLAERLLPLRKRHAADEREALRRMERNADALEQPGAERAGSLGRVAAALARLED